MGTCAHPFSLGICSRDSGLPWPWAPPVHLPCPVSAQPCCPPLSTAPGLLSLVFSCRSPTATVNICGATAEECLMRARRGPAVGHRLGQMVHHYPFLFITSSACRDWPASSRLLGGAAGPAILEGRNGPSFRSTCLPASFEPQTFPARAVPGVLGRAWSRSAAATCLRGLGEGPAQDRNRGPLGTPAGGSGGQRGSRTPRSQLRAEAARKPLLSPLPAGLQPAGHNLPQKERVLHLCPAGLVRALGPADPWCRGSLCSGCWSGWSSTAICRHSRPQPDPSRGLPEPLGSHSLGSQPSIASDLQGCRVNPPIPGLSPNCKMGARPP
ncbi:uncharacterized protein LOC118880542 isoform X2 [Balaenoptera musculus]|uniref:Uncharacterized protein LOC118880542 isoform X2 n=1 Tax=Balaenoptera musculus TaxID=9771 RepID=A0A8B8V5G7_BALMU|nr:uncharacterized protein LOC118880542 isoform X2 [Balaenoptera musculus]